MTTVSTAKTMEQYAPIMNERPRFMSIPQWVNAFGYIPEGGIRHLIFTNDDFNRRVVRRLGRKVLLDVQALEDYIAEQTANPNGRG